MNRAGLMAGAAMIVVAALIGPAPVERSAAAAMGESVATGWPQDRSDLRADPNVRFGMLPNGMRFAVMRNTTPAGAASFRLRIGAGSLHEDDDQRGLAHFVEHLALNATENVPEGELVRILERHGLQFGPDTNAVTSFEQTIYMLDLPSTRTETVDTALFLMREAVGRATLAAETIERERGVVLSEERTRAVPQLMMAIDELDLAFGDDLIGNRIPIGLPEVIQQAPRERFVSFYEAYYRPERATFVAVGDFDVDDMEARIRASFGDWTGRGQAGAEPEPPRIGRRDPDFRIFAAPGVPTRLSMSWVRPMDWRPDSRAVRRERLVETLALAVLRTRLQRLAASEAAFVSQSFVSHSPVGGRGTLTQLTALSDPARWRESLAFLEQEQRRVVEHGVTQAELDREIAQMRAGLAAAASGGATRPSPQVAMSLIASVNEGRVFLSPADLLALFDESVGNLAAEQANDALRTLFGGPAPAVHFATPVPVEGAEQALMTAFAQSRAIPVSAPEMRQALTWPYGDFGGLGEEVSRTDIPEIGATAVRFANGARLTVKPTDFRDDEILVEVRFGDGRLGATGAEPLFGFLNSFVAAGLGQLSAEDVAEALAGRVQSARTGFQDSAFQLTGATRPEDFSVQLQLLAAHVADPGWRDSAWERVRSLAGVMHDQFETSPAGIFNRDGHALLRSGDPRWAPPSREQLASMTMEELRSELEPHLASGPVEIIIVGDIGVEEAVGEVARTFGALPARASPRTPAASVAFPQPAVEWRTHSGREDQALAFIAWPTRGFYSDQRRARALNLLAAVFQLRLINEVRERLGAAYAPIAQHNSATDYDYGYLSATAPIHPDAMNEFLDSLWGITASLREQPIEEDELERARRPLLERLRRSRASSNQWWLSQLAGIQERPERLQSLLLEVEHYEAISGAEIQRLAGEFLRDERAWQFIVLPEASDRER